MQSASYQPAAGRGGLRAEAHAEPRGVVCQRGQRQQSRAPSQYRTPMTKKDTEVYRQPAPASAAPCGPSFQERAEKLRFSSTQITHVL